MNKISKIYSFGKAYIKSFFDKSTKIAKSPVFEQAENTAAKISDEPAKVTSKQIEAYYKRYGKHVQKTTKSKTNKVITEEEMSEVQKMVQKECDAYNKIRFVDVSEEALKSLQHNFEQKKQKVMDLILSNSENLPAEYIQKVKQIKTPEQLAYVIRSFESNANSILQKRFTPVIEQTLKGKNLPLKIQKEIFQEENKVCDKYLELVKAVTEESKDPKVLQIEKYLKSMYNMEYVHLETIEEARKILKTVQLAVKNNIPLPKNIIITSFTPTMTSGVNISYCCAERSVIIRSQKEISDSVKKAFEQFTLPESQRCAEIIKSNQAKWFSTNDELHLYLHEFCHSYFFLESLLQKKLQEIPAKYHNTARNVGLYAITARNELATELKTKSLLRSLNKNEQNLLDYFV